MKSILVNSKITKNKIISLKDYYEIKVNHRLNEYILYTDNILEGITLLNHLTLNNEILKLIYVVYEPIDQPIYIFEDENNKYGIKISGAYDKWDLPKDVSQIINYIDLPDYVLYSIGNQRAILAGENTETASVGNSQWQREGRKIGAAIVGVPFIYQTFYSGRDESRDTIREPSSLQVYNHLVYSIRYKTPSIVAYFENNFENSNTRARNPRDSEELFANYIKSIIVADANTDKIETRKKYEKLFFKHMIEYLRESKYNHLTNKNPKSRLLNDLPPLNSNLKNDMLYKTNDFVDNLVNYLYEGDVTKRNNYLNNSQLLNFNNSKFKDWTSYNNKKYISHIIHFLHQNNKSPKSYVKGSAKVGFVDTLLCKKFLISKFPSKRNEIEAVLDGAKYPESILMPLRLHKRSNKTLTWSPDPESGEIVAFSELFSKDLKNQKSRPVIGYCIADTPKSFQISQKEGTKLYKALSEYIDILIINNKIYFNLPYTFTPSNYVPLSIEDTKPLDTTEEMAIVSTYLNQSTINSDWKLCFIHTHHSSWQQLVIYKDGVEIQEKINRKSTKVDLIMQENSKFMISEGKNNFESIMSDEKIQTAIKKASDKINLLYEEKNKQFDAFIYNYPAPKKDTLFYVTTQVNMIENAMKKGHFSDVAYNKDYIVIIVYLDINNKTKFKLVFSPNFDLTLRKQLEMEFNQ